jgi:hypothetical protein
LLAVEKRTPLGAALLIATSALMLSGCVSDKTAADAAALAATPVDPALATTGLRHPCQPAIAIRWSPTSPAQRSRRPTRRRGTDDRRFGGHRARQYRRPRAAADRHQRAGDEHLLGPPTPPEQSDINDIADSGGNAYAPVGVSATRSSVYSSPAAVEQAPQGQVFLPQHSSKIPARRRIDPSRPHRWQAVRFPGRR